MALRYPRILVLLLVLCAGFMLGRGSAGRDDRANLVIALGTVVLAFAGWMEFRGRARAEREQKAAARSRLADSAVTAAGQIESVLDLQGAGHAIPDWMAAVLSRRPIVDGTMNEVLQWATRAGPAHSDRVNAAVQVRWRNFHWLTDKFTDTRPSQLLLAGPLINEPGFIILALAIPTLGYELPLAKETVLRHTPHSDHFHTRGPIQEGDPFYLLVFSSAFLVSVYREARVVYRNNLSRYSPDDLKQLQTGVQNAKKITSANGLAVMNNAAPQLHKLFE